MYKNQIVVLVKKDGQPLRETEGKYVFLPFNSEYSLEIKNQSNKRAVASVKIDGTDVLGEDEIIIPAYGSFPLERFITNGDLANGKKFKFVPLSNSKVQDPSSPENGLIEIEVWFEKLPEIKIYYSPPYYPMWSSSNHWYTYTSAVGQTSNMSYRTYSGGAPIKCCSNSSEPIMVSSVMTSLGTSHAGATVEGSKSDQSFSRGIFGQKDYPSTVFKFWLRGVEQEVTTSDKLYCTNCGKKTRFDYKYCPRCGSPLQIA